MSAESRNARRRRLTFSFDSSGWLYVFHAGAASYIQKYVLPFLPEDAVAFSGSSGGALIAAMLANGLNIDELANYVIECHAECQFNPWRMLPVLEAALHKFMPVDAHLRCQNRLRILLTKVEPSWMPLRPSVASVFSSREETLQYLRASCHIPLLGGLKGFAVSHSDGSRSSYFDGLFWPSLLCAWRVFEPGADSVIKVSAAGWPTAHITPPIPAPPHWIVLPPSEQTLWTLFEAGQSATARFFQTPAGRRLLAGRTRGQPPALPPAPPPSRALVRTLMLGWWHLLLLTCFFLLAPPYLACREYLRPPSLRERSAAGVRPRDRAGAVLRHGLVVSAALILWPLVFLLTLGRSLAGAQEATPSNWPPSPAHPSEVSAESPLRVAGTPASSLAAARARKPSRAAVSPPRRVAGRRRRARAGNTS